MKEYILELLKHNWIRTTENKIELFYEGINSSISLIGENGLFVVVMHFNGTVIDIPDLQKDIQQKFFDCLNGLQFSEIIEEKEIKSRTFILYKADMVATLSLIIKNRFLIYQLDPRNGIPNVSEYKSKEEADLWFEKSLILSKERGWKLKEVEIIKPWLN